MQGIQGVSKIKDGYNPATWMLEVTTAAQEHVLGVDFSDIYKNSELYQWVNFDRTSPFMSSCLGVVVGGYINNYKERLGKLRPTVVSKIKKKQLQRR